MEKVLFLVHGEGGEAELRRQSLEAMAAARDLAAGLGCGWEAGLVGGDAGAVAAQLAGCGAARLLAVTGPEFEQPRYASDAAAAEVLCRAADATLVVAAATSRWGRVLAGVSHRLGGCVDTHVTRIECGDGGPSVTRWVYRQRIETVLRRSRRPWLLTVEAGIAPAFKAQPGGVPPEVVPVELTLPPFRSQVTGIEAPPADQQTIRPDAELLFVAGAGWTKKQPDGTVKAAEAGQLIVEFLAKSRASLGSTKSLVDLGGDGQPVLHSSATSTKSARPARPRATRRVSPPAATARHRTPSAGGSSTSAAR